MEPAEQFADELDRATYLAEAERTAAQAMRKPEPPHTGMCNGPGCENKVPVAGVSFCCRECRDAYESENISRR